MSEKSKRRFFQIHLSTSVLLLLLAGGLLLVNFQAEVVKVGVEKQHVTFKKQGWPYRFVSVLPNKQSFEISDGERCQRAIEECTGLLLEANDAWRLLLADVAIGVLILSVAAYYCEWFIRRDTEYESERRRRGFL